MRIFSTLRHTIILLAVLCASCGTALPTIKPYKLDVQQGNVVTSKMLLQLHPGMTKSQVRFIMGTPLIQDSFHGNRWDYVYQMREKGKVIDQHRVILDFEGESLKTVRGDVVAKGTEPNASVEGVANNGTRVINPTGKKEEKSWFDKLKFWKKDEVTPAKEAQDAKAKAEAEDAAKDSAVQVKEDLDQTKENLDQQSATPLEEPQSIMAVPLEALPVTPAAAEENSANVALPKSDTTKTQPKEAVVKKATKAKSLKKSKATSNVAKEAVKKTEATESSPSSSDLTFDRSLKLDGETK